MSRRNSAAALFLLGCALIQPCSASPDSVVVFNEIHYNPAGSSESGEWIELFNQMGIKVDISGWKIDGLGYTFPAGTILNPGAYAVVAKTPAAGQFGPFPGALDNGGETLRLINQSDRMMDEITYDDVEPWPTGPDNSGCTLAKLLPYTASGDPANWTTSAQVNGTPGALNFPTPPAADGLRFNEIQSTSATNFGLEITNTSTSPANLSGVIVSADGNASRQYTLPAGTLAPGALLWLDETTLGFRPAAGEKLFLYNSAKSAVFDTREATTRLAGRADQHQGAWLYPNAATPGAPNNFTFSDAVVISEIQYHPAALPATPNLPLRDSNNQWVEIANRSAATVNLAGWSFSAGIAITFPAGTTLAPGEHACVVRDPALFSAAYPTARMLGTFTGSLARSGEKLVLSDPAGNPADEVRYYDGGQWPEFADGGGPSMELRDLHADNSTGGAWAASDESSRTAWKTYTYTATAAASKGSDAQWSEFNFGLLAAGEMWIDDVSVIENGTTQKLLDTGFNNASRWRLRGNHRHSEIISEPGNPGNKILRLVATGPTEHMHNQIETTLASPITNGRTYQISFRARWITGMNQLHTRLYFNRVAKMNVIDRPTATGTPSAPNSRAVANIGPTFSSLRHSPVVPSATEATTITAAATDPDAVSDMTLFYSVNGAAFATTPMTLANGFYQGTVPPQALGATVQFYLRGTDSLGAVSYYPAAGPDSRALYRVNDGTAATNGLHNFRLITTIADKNFMHTATEVMSNDRIDATVIDREGDIYYGAGVRLKSSERGRNQVGRVGYNIDFPPDGLFRGAHAGVAIDRSEGSAPGQKELLFDMMISNSGGPISRYNDLIKILSPNSSLTGTALLQMARYEDVFLDEQFENGGDGALYEYELIYFPKTANAAGAKLPEPDDVRGISVSNQGDDLESYRWNFLNKINREAENYSPIMNYCKLFSLTGAAFETALPSVVDVDPWLRGMAYAVLTGAPDNAGSGSQHNGIYYARPDGRIIFFPHDMDYSTVVTANIYANAECAKLTTDPARRRIYLGHLHDIISTTYNNSYMSIWSNHFATLDPAQNWATELTAMTDRSNYVLAQINAQIAPVAFGITTPSPLTTSGSTATIAGNGWVNVRDIRIAGSAAPLAVTWTGTSAWQVTVPALPGSNTVALEALDFSGTVIGTASIVVNSTAVVDAASADNLMISEIMYHPANPTAAEISAGFTDAEQFEFIELMNVGPNAVNLTGVRFLSGIEYDFSAGKILGAGARIVVARDRSAFLSRYPSAAPTLAEGAFLNGTGLNNGGETLILKNAAGDDIRNFAYDDASPWPLTPDGDGPSLVLIAPATHPDPALGSNWRASFLPIGNPGTTDARTFTGPSGTDTDNDGLPALVEYALGTSDSTFTPNAVSLTRTPDGYVTATYPLDRSAEDAVSEIQCSENLTTWSPAFTIISSTPTGTNSTLVTARSQTPAPEKFFIRLSVRTR